MPNRAHPPHAAFILTKAPKDIVTAVEAAAVYKAGLPWKALVVQALLAGIFIGIAGHVSVMTGGSLPSSWREPGALGLQRLIFAAVFPVGLISIVLTGGELFTGDAMVLFMALMAGKVSIKDLARVWTTVFVCNWIGCLLVAIFLVYIPTAYDGNVAHAFIINLAEKKCHLGWGNALLLAIGANFLVCIAVFQAVGSQDTHGKICALWWPIFAFVAVGFEHSIANMFLVSMGAMVGANVNAFDVLIMNLLPVTIGNIIGGAGFVGLAYWLVYDKLADHPVPQQTLLPTVTPACTGSAEASAPLTSPSGLTPTSPDATDAATVAIVVADK